MEDRDIEQLLHRVDFARPGAQERVWQRVIAGMEQEATELSDDAMDLLWAAGTPGAPFPLGTKDPGQL